MLDTINKKIPNPDDLPVITQEALNDILEHHAMFLRGQVGGQRAILQYKNLSELDFHNHDLSQADFTGSMFVHSDLSLGIYKCACFFACDLRDADLSHADLSRTDLRGSYLAGANLSGANLIDADMRAGKIMQKGKKGAIVDRERTGGSGTKTILTGARLTNAEMSGLRARGADFTNADLSKASTHNANFSDATFQGANLSSTDFTGSDLTYADMNHAILSGAVLDHTESFGLNKTNAITDQNIGQKIEDSGKTLTQLLDEHHLWIKTAGDKGKQLDLSGYDLRDLTDLRMFPLTAIRAIKATFLNLDLSNMQMQSATLDKSDFRDCYMENIDLRGSNLKNVQMTRANLRGARLSPLQFKTKNKGIRLSRVDLSGSDLRFTNFQEADLRDAVLMGADLTHADLTGADLRRADFTGARIKNTCFNNVNLEGAIIDFSSL